MTSNETLETAVKALNVTAGPNGLVLPLVLFGARERFSLNLFRAITLDGTHESAR